MAANHSTILDAAERGVITDAPIVTATANTWVEVTLPPLSLLAAVYIQARGADAVYTRTAQSDGGAATATSWTLVPANSGMLNIFENTAPLGASQPRSFKIWVAPGGASPSGVILSYVRL